MKDMHTHRHRQGAKSAVKSIALFSLFAVLSAFALAAGEPPRPNIIFIYADDLGYSDLGVYGAKGIKTPNIDRLALGGTRFTSFYVAQAVCTASRAALLTGCYPNRVSLYGALNHLSTTGINPDEILIPEILRSKGYVTALFGKWHLGTKPMFNPMRHGFDEYFGIPYSNDNSKYHPSVKGLPPLPLYEGDSVIETDPDQSQFTQRITEHAVSFIERNRDTPFFLYVPHIMPHVPIFASEKFKGKSDLGLYGDVVEELDWSVGEILNTLRENNLDDKTLVIFSSDNGPFLSYGNHAGQAYPLREGKLTSFEGGIRTPFIARWPGHIPAARECDDPICAIDMLPTFCALAGAPLPKAKIDGKNIWPIMAGVPGALNPHEALFFYAGEELQAVRSGPWKLHFAHPYLTVAGDPGRDGKPSNFDKLEPASHTKSGLEGIASRHGYRVEHLALSLFNLVEDPGETKNVAEAHPEVVEKLKALAEPMRKELGDSLTGVKGSEIRAPGESK
jgi:arylsulfatase A-like enzyme